MVTRTGDDVSDYRDVFAAQYAEHQRRFGDGGEIGFTVDHRLQGRLAEAVQLRLHLQSLLAKKALCQRDMHQHRFRLVSEGYRDFRQQPAALRRRFLASRQYRAANRDKERFGQYGVVLRNMNH